MPEEKKTNGYVKWKVFVFIIAGVFGMIGTLLTITTITANAVSRVELESVKERGEIKLEFLKQVGEINTTMATINEKLNK